VSEAAAGACAAVLDAFDFAAFFAAGAFSAFAFVALAGDAPPWSLEDSGAAAAPASAAASGAC
jgi:hypothetical protein